MKINLSKRIKLVLALIIAAVLIVGGVLGYLFKTGKNKIEADTLGDTKTYTISGRSFDPLANAPIEGQTIIVASDTGQTTQAATDVNGNYSVNIKASIDGFINVSMGDGGIEGGTRTFITNNNDQAFTYDLNIGNPPFDAGAIAQDVEVFQTNQMETLSSGLDSEPALNYLEPVVIDGVYYSPFFTFRNDRIDNKYVLDSADLAAKKDSIEQAAEWLRTLKKSTGVINYFPVIIVPEIDWAYASGTKEYPAGYMRSHPLPYNNQMVLDIDELSTSLISHEFGHHVDWVMGNESGISTFSTESNNFFWAYQALIKSKAITGYAAENSHELFAELFELIFLTKNDNSGEVDLLKQYYYANDIGNYLLFSPDAVIFNWSSSKLTSLGENSSERFIVHNSLMYVYKHLAAMSRQIEYFPGKVTVSKNYLIGGPDNVFNGLYMDNVGVVTLTLSDHRSKPIESGRFSIDGKEVKIAPADPDYHIINGSEKLLMPIGIGKKLLNIDDLPSDYSVPFVGQTLDIKPGSNYFEINYRKLAVQYKLHSEFYPLDRASEYGNPPVFAAELTHKTGLKIKGLKQGDIPRYPTEGTYFGYGQYDRQLTDLARANGEKNTYYYKVDYVIGGDDEHLFPLQAKFTGPMGAMPPQMLATFPIPTATTKEIKKVSDIVTGILTKKCDYIKYPNVAFPNICH